MRLRGVERWISIVRLIVFPFVLAIVALADFPAGWGLWAWVTTTAYALGMIAFFVLSRSRLGEAHALLQSLLAQLFDTAIVVGYVLVFSFEPGAPVQQLLYIDLAAACVRFEILGGLLLAAASAPIVVGFEKLRVGKLYIAYSWKLVELQTGLETLMALIVGWLVRRLVIEGGQAEARAREAEQLRDELARRVDLADAAYESERRTVEELRRVSSLRADFVSLVSHEVRTPMAAVIGSAQTLRRRWRELSAEQRDAFLALIADEIERLAALVTEVLDSSRIDEGTFSYSFRDLDLGTLVNDVIATAELGREVVRISESPRRPRRPGPAAPGPDQPDRQCDQVLARGLADRGAGERRERPCERRGRRPRGRDRRRRPGPRLRAVRARQDHRGEARKRPRSLHRTRDRGGA